MFFFLSLPFVVQAIVIGFDEYFFHVKRGLPRWERIGHPLDSLSVLLCLLFLVVFPYSSTALKIYLALALFSCIFVTKDEFIHKECCSASEQWLHSVLFLNHPVLLTAGGILWPYLHPTEVTYPLTHRLPATPFLKGFLISQTILVAFFMLYQIIYWNFIWAKKEK